MKSECKICNYRSTSRENKLILPWQEIKSNEFDQTFLYLSGLADLIEAITQEKWNIRIKLQYRNILLKVMDWNSESQQI